MAPMWKPALIALLLGSGVLSGIATGAPQTSGNAVFDRTVEIVNEEFYRSQELDAFNNKVKEILTAPTGLSGAEPKAVNSAIDTLLASLRTSHTARYTPDRIAYYELVDIFRYNYRRSLRRMFPPDGTVRYEGVGMATRVVDGKPFVADVYDGGAAARAGVMTGDEILAVDGAAFREVDSFRGKSGKDVVLTLRRQADGPELSIKVGVEKLRPSESLVEAIKDSIRVFDRNGQRIGYVRIWSFTDRNVERILASELGGGRLADSDGLILDLRGRWGGAPADAAEMFVGGTPAMTMIERDGKSRYINSRWRKPVVAIIDEGSRSGMELFANALKNNRIPLVGTETAGAVVAGRGFLLPDDSLLVLAVADVSVDGLRLEGNPVQPDLRVPFDFRYANGADPQLDAALGKMTSILSGG